MEGEEQTAEGQVEAAEGGGGADKAEGKDQTVEVVVEAVQKGGGVGEVEGRKAGENSTEGPPKSVDEAV